MAKATSDVEKALPSADDARKGAFVRRPTTFRHWIEDSPDAKFPAESGRYHLYISHACPWAHRTMVVRQLKDLESVISVSVVHWDMDERGWRFKTPEEDAPGATEDHLHPGFRRLSELYFHVEPEYSGRYTVPILFDKKTDAFVNNESSEIIRMFNKAFNGIAGNPQLDLYPESAALRDAIDGVNEWVYPNINNGVYACGFSRGQEPYEKAYRSLFESLDRAETLLASQRWLAGDRFSEADVRLWTTLVRFDLVYHVHFKCNAYYLKDLPNVSAFIREIYQLPGIADDAVTNFHHMKQHYYGSHASINPHRIVPTGPRHMMDPKATFSAPHGRESLGGEPAMSTAS